MHLVTLQAPLRVELIVWTPRLRRMNIDLNRRACPDIGASGDAEGALADGLAAYVVSSSISSVMVISIS